MTQLRLGCALFLALCATVAAAAAPQQAIFYLVDIGHGNVAFVVSPSGETMLLDCGPSYAVDRIYGFMQQNGIKKIDYLVISHFEDDHMGAVAALAKKVDIVNYVDHGESVTYGKSDEWWRGRRSPWWRPGIGEADNKLLDAYKAARATGHHILVNPGDRPPVKGLDVVVVAAAGQNIAKPLAAGGHKNPACSQVAKRAEDDAEDGQSVGVVIGNGKFRFIYLADMTWNNSYRLFCPKNMVGTVDAYLVTHHAQSMNTDLGEYYGLASCSMAEVQGLHPRVALLSMGSQGHKYGTPDAMQNVRSLGIDLWQTEKITAGGEAGLNAPDDYIANIGGLRSDQTPYIKLVPNPDSSFAVFNSRNNFTKNYPPRK